MAFSDEERQARAAEYKRHLDTLGPQGRSDYVDMARRNEDWPSPRDRYLASHARKWGRGLRGEDYAQRAFDVKNRPGVQVLAYVHPVKGNRGLAFVDLQLDEVVQFDTDLDLNFDLIQPSNGARRWVADKIAIGTHWRLKDTER